MRRWQKIVVPGSKWGRLFFVVFIEEFLAEPNQGNGKSAKSQDKPYHSFSFQLKPSLHFEPRRVGPPTWHRYLPIRRGSRFFSLLPQITCFLVQPRRIGPPTRHRTLPIRRGSRFFSLFASNYSLPTRATSCWTPNATWLPSNTTWLYLIWQYPLTSLPHIKNQPPITGGW